MKIDWRQSFIAIVKQYRGNRTDTAYARFLGITRQSLQRILSGRTRIDYTIVQTVLRRLGLCHCLVAGLECSHGPNNSQTGEPA